MGAQRSVAEVAQRYANVARGGADPDFAALFAPEVRVWHNYDDEPTRVDGRQHASTIQSVFSANSLMAQAVPDFRNEVVRLRVTEDAFVLTWIVRATGSQGEGLEVPHCSIITVAGGVITAIDDYSDRQQGAPLMEMSRSLLTRSAVSDD